MFDRSFEQQMEECEARRKKTQQMVVIKYRVSLQKAKADLAKYSEELHELEAEAKDTMFPMTIAARIDIAKFWIEESHRRVEMFNSFIKEWEQKDD